MSTTEVRSGLIYEWGSGFSGWAGDMDANIARIGRFSFHLSVKDRDLTAPPGTPANGDCYIVATGGTGAWSGHDNKVMVWLSASSTWAIGVPRIGWQAYIEDEQVLTVYKGSAWSAGIAI